MPSIVVAIAVQMWCLSRTERLGAVNVVNEWDMVRAPFLSWSKQRKAISNQGGTARERPWPSNAELDEARSALQRYPCHRLRHVIRCYDSLDKRSQG
ncbi:hypothetical protein [uncultured Corynebacterium sp.]|uniref:hypothetical protein n=1 Tax=uncultured Corynebacterium sp. TaxID=159447 RepID=UPI0025D913BD|nr:hypothetical protein [uncultured Corynebacterium sp.]